MARWMIERKAMTQENDLLQVVEVYAPGESKELVKRENKMRTYTRKLITL